MLRAILITQITHATVIPLRGGLEGRVYRRKHIQWGGGGFLVSVRRKTGAWGENQLGPLLFRILIVRREEPFKYSL